MKLELIASIYHAASHSYTFLCVTLHRSDSPSDRILTEDKLYHLAGPGLHPDGTHYEMELNNETVTNLGIPQPSVIHDIQAEDGRYFVCYPNKVETEEDAHRIFLIWAIGTVASMHEGRDVLVPNFDPHISLEDFSRIMMASYGVNLAAFHEERVSAG